MKYDVAIVGGGPAGATCAAFCAQAGLATVVLERAVFPREKVCGDCLNPACWPILDRLGIAGEVLAHPHSQLAEIEFLGINARSLRFPLQPSARGEIAIQRRLFDQVLLERARAAGAEIREGTAVTSLQSGWRIITDRGECEAKTLVAADGRNSTVARLLGLLPAAKKDRIGVQTRVPAPAGFGDRVVMRFLPTGYCGVASLGGGELNVCLVSTGERLGELKRWAGSHFRLSENPDWRTITPLSRAPISPTGDALYLVGDTARVVEPFTGEGIYYALATGELAARHVIAQDPSGYRTAHRALYSGRLWVNRLAKAAALHPQLATWALGMARWHPAALRYLTAKVVGAPLLKRPAAATASAQGSSRQSPGRPLPP